MIGARDVLYLLENNKEKLVLELNKVIEEDNEKLRRQRESKEETRKRLLKELREEKIGDTFYESFDTMKVWEKKYLNPDMRNEFYDRIDRKERLKDLVSLCKRKEIPVFGHLDKTLTNILMYCMYSDYSWGAYDILDFQHDYHSYDDVSMEWDLNVSLQDLLKVSQEWCRDVYNDLIGGHSAFYVT